MNRNEIIADTLHKAGVAGSMQLADLIAEAIGQNENILAGYLEQAFVAGERADPEESRKQMADIKQAAKWMQDRKHVRRAGDEPKYVWERGRGIYRGNEDEGEVMAFTSADLLAEDWEIAE